MKMGETDRKLKKMLNGKKMITIPTKFFVTVKKTNAFFPTVLQKVALHEKTEYGFRLCPIEKRTPKFRSCTCEAEERKKSNRPEKHLRFEEWQLHLILAANEKIFER